MEKCISKSIHDFFPIKKADSFSMQPLFIPKWFNQESKLCLSYTFNTPGHGQPLLGLFFNGMIYALYLRDNVSME